MNIFKRLAQFLIIYSFGLGMLWSAKFFYHLSDYLIPSPSEVFTTVTEQYSIFATSALNTLMVSVAGHGLSVVLATIVALIGRSRSWIGNLTRMAAYNLQSYPVVAVAPIIFLFLGDGLSSRLLIASLICYFPLLLNFIGIFSGPVDEIEHFYRITGRMNWRTELAIRSFENLDKITTVMVGSGTMAMVGTIVAEFLAATDGIGYVIRKALYQSSLSKILISLFFIGLFSSIYLSIIEIGGTYLKRSLTEKSRS